MRYGSVCSGIEAASAAWGPLGWEPGFFAEIDPFACAVLKHHHPNVPNYGDFTQMLDPSHEVHHAPPIDLLVGGTPCQDFSVAGLRAGIEGARGSLTVAFLQLAQVLRPRWVVWENVPGVLSSDGGRALGAFLGGLEELGYGWAYRVLDAQYVRVDGHPRAVPQRRRRVFVVGHIGGDWLRPASVLLEPEGSDRHLVPRRSTRENAASVARRSPAADGGAWAERPHPEHRPVEDGRGGNGRGDSGVVALGFEPRYDTRDNKTGGAPATAHNHVPTLSFKPGQSEAAGGVFITEEFAPTLQAQNNGSTAVPAVAYCASSVAGTLDANYGRGAGERAGVEREFVGEHLAFNFDQYSGRETPFSPTLTQTEHKGKTLVYPAGDARWWDGGAVAHTVTCKSDVQRMPDKGHLQCVVLPANGDLLGEVAPTLTAANNPSRSPQSAEVTAQVSAVLHAQAIGVDSYNLCTTGSVQQTLKSPRGGVTESMGAVLVPSEAPSHAQAIAENHDGYVYLTPVPGPLMGGPGGKPGMCYPAVRTGMAVRRLTPTECERLMGFPDGHTRIAWKNKPATDCPDGPRYKALGNSMAVNCMRWIGERILLVDEVFAELEEGAHDDP